MNKDSIQKKGTEYHLSIEIYIFRENETYVAYCPSLDLSTCAQTHNEVISAFYEMLQLHLECCVEAGTLESDLLAHGWKIKKKDLTPPTFLVLAKKPEMKKLLDGAINYERVVAPARIPTLA